MNAPVATFALLAYNQEKFIREAISGAFSQTYESLEIILSDDCSSDQTYKIMEEMSKKYKGSHRITLNKNNSNLGLIEHLERVVSLSNSNYIILAAGDDISKPYRVERIMSKFFENNNNMAVFSNVEKIDSNSNFYGSYFESEPQYCNKMNDFMRGFPCWILGASSAYHKSLFYDFDTLAKDNFQEDAILSFRALVKGNLVYSNEKLVCYRIHSGSVSHTLDFNKRVKFLKNQVNIAKSYRKDLIKHESINVKVHLRVLVFMFKAYLVNFLFSNKILSTLIIKTLLFFKIINNSHREG